MNFKKTINATWEKWRYGLVPFLVVCFNLLIVLFPKETIGAAKDGLGLWFNHVLPSLLPFVVGANLLMGLGFVHFLAVLLEPVMLPLFGVSGSGGFALAIGLLSGYPMGAKTTSELRKNELISKNEGNRLLAFTNNSGPLFVLGAVATSMFSNIWVGYFVLTVHYLGAFATGILFRFFANSKEPIAPIREQNLLRRAYSAMSDAKKKDKRAFGAMLGQSVTKSMETMLLIGGFIILFSVLSAVLSIIGFYDICIAAITPLGTRLGIPSSVYYGTMVGIFEMTGGARALSEILLNRSTLVCLSLLISWGGLSIHAQAISFIAKTDLNPFFYVFGKIVHGIISAFLTYLLYPFFRVSISNFAVVPVWAQMGPAKNFLYSSFFFACCLGFLLLIGIVFFVRQITNKNYRKTHRGTFLKTIKQKFGTSHKRTYGATHKRRYGASHRR